MDGDDMAGLLRAMLYGTPAPLLAPGVRCSAYWYSLARRLPPDLGSLMTLGAQAAAVARWEGIVPWQVPEGWFWVHMWPEEIWDEAVVQLREQRQPPPPLTLAQAAGPSGDAAYDSVYGNAGAWVRGYRSGPWPDDPIAADDDGSDPYR